MNTYNHNTLACGSCGRTCDASSSVHGSTAPKTGDVTICLYCAAFGIFEVHPDGKLSLRTMRPLEFATLEPEHRRELEMLRGVIVRDRLKPRTRGLA